MRTHTKGTPQIDRNSQMSVRSSTQPHPSDKTSARVLEASMPPRCDACTCGVLIRRSLGERQLSAALKNKAHVFYKHVFLVEYSKYISCIHEG